MLGPADSVRFQGLAADALRIFDQAPLLQIRPELEKLRTDLALAQERVALLEQDAERVRQRTE